jgi:hypothetical protein
LTYQHYKAGCLELFKQDKQALKLYKRVLKKERRLLGNDHEDTMHTMNNIGFVLSKMRHYNECLGYLFEVVARRTRVLGPDHADTITSIQKKVAVINKLGFHM